MRDTEAENDLRQLQEAVFCGDADVERLNDSVADYIGNRNSKLYIKTAAKRKIIYWACGIYVAIIAYGKYHYLLPWHIS
jgi:hypothetical protein